MDEVLIKLGVASILDGLGVDRNDRNFLDTPDRVFRLYKELFEKQFTSLPVYDEPRNDEMIILRGHRTWGMCPHHLLPVDYSVSVGYIPTGQVLGLSKLARLVEQETSGFRLQESIGPSITEYLMTKVSSMGAGCIITGKHGCMRIRGVKTTGDVITSALRGVIFERPEARAEFFRLAHSSNG